MADKHRIQGPPQGETRFVELLWEQHLPKGPRSLEILPQVPGLFMILSWNVVHGPRTLQRIDSAKSLSADVAKAKDEWFGQEWDVEVYFAQWPHGEAEDISDIRELLVWAHTPALNGRSVWTVPDRVANLRIWNTGICPRLIPDISGQHPWFKRTP